MIRAALTRQSCLAANVIPVAKFLYLLDDYLWSEVCGKTIENLHIQSYNSMKQFSIILVVFIILPGMSCKHKEHRALLPKVNGMPGEVLMIIDNGNSPSHIKNLAAVSCYKFVITATNINNIPFLITATGIIPLLNICTINCTGSIYIEAFTTVSGNNLVISRKSTNRCGSSGCAGCTCRRRC